MVASGRPRYFCAKKSLCTLRVCRSYERGGKYLECPQHLSKRRKEGKKRVSHIDGGEWAAITETASFGVLVRRRRAMSARAADVKLPSYQIFPALLFSSKNGLRRRLLRFPTSAAPRPNGWMNSLSSLCSPECGKRQLPAINAIIEDCARALHSVSNSYHTATVQLVTRSRIRLGFFGIRERGAYTLLACLLPLSLAGYPMAR